MDDNNQEPTQEETHEQMNETPSPDYYHNLDMIDGMLELEPEERDKKIEEYIEAKLADFESLPQQPKMGAFFKTFHKGPIRKDTEIYRTMMFDPFCVDDPEIYRLMIETVDELKKTPGWEEIESRKAIFAAIQLTLSKYFGNFMTFTETEAGNQNFYMDSSTTGSSHIALSELKGKEIGVCAEKAAVSQNLFSLLGVDSYFVCSSHCKVDGENEGQHAYNIIQTQAGYFLVDFANPKLMTREEDSIIETYNPAVYPITKEQFQIIQNDGEIEIENDDFIRQTNGDLKPMIRKRIYAGTAKDN